MNTELIDRIFEASFVPELWPDLLDEMARITDGKGGFSYPPPNINESIGANYDSFNG